MDAGAAVMLGLFAFLTVTSWASSRREQREMEMRYELYRRMIEHPGLEAQAVRALLERDEHQRQATAAARRREGGLTVLAVGMGLGAFLYFIAPRSGVYAIALIPILVGLVILFWGSRARRPADS
jgi:hypothetical protein